MTLNEQYKEFEDAIYILYNMASPLSDLERDRYNNCVNIIEENLERIRIDWGIT